MEVTTTEVAAAAAAEEALVTAEEALAVGEVAVTSSKILSDIWKYFTRKEKVTKDQNGNEKFEQIICCNIGQCYLSPNNSTTTLERHLKSKHHNAYLELYEKRIVIEPWSIDI